MVLSAEERQHSVQQRRYSLLQDEDQAAFLREAGGLRRRNRVASGHRWPAAEQARKEAQDGEVQGD